MDPFTVGGKPSPYICDSDFQPLGAFNAIQICTSYIKINPTKSINPTEWNEKEKKKYSKVWGVESVQNMGHIVWFYGGSNKKTAI